MACGRRVLIGLVLLLLLVPMDVRGEAVDPREAVAPEEAERLMQAGAGVERALLVGIDDFVTRPSAYPSSTNNVYAMQEMFQGALNPLESLLLPSRPVTSSRELTQLIQYAFGNAGANDVSYLYISTHGVYDPENGVEPALLLSDGTTEGKVSPAELEAAFDGIPGVKVIILDACNSGAFIGKGMAEQPEGIAFLGEDFKVLASSGAMEESWYWSAKEGEGAGAAGEGQGSFYFTQALCDALSAASGFPADQNHDGSVTLRELYDYLLLNHAASTPQVYPQTDDFTVFAYDLEAPLPAGTERSPIMDVTFSGTTLSRSDREISVEFIAMRPVQVAYQLVYRNEGRWLFSDAQLVYDQVERFTAFGDQAGAIMPGRKVRSLTLDDLPEDAYGYVLVQLVSIENGKLRIHAGRVICVPPDTGDQTLAVQTPAVFSRAGGRELPVFVGHDYPCALSVAIVNEAGQTVSRLCHRRGTRPMGLTPEGSVLYWDGSLKSGAQAPPGRYKVRVQAVLNDQTITAESDFFTME